MDKKTEKIPEGFQTNQKNPVPLTDTGKPN